MDVQIGCPRESETVHGWIDGCSWRPRDDGQGKIGTGGCCEVHKKNMSVMFELLYVKSSSPSRYCVHMSSAALAYDE
jgi:hypothetical protein